MTNANNSINTDWLTAGFARLQPAGYVRRSASTNTMRSYFVVALQLALSACTDKGGYFVEASSSTAASAEADNAKDLILPLEVDLQVAESFVKIGFGLNENQRFQSTEFLTPRLRVAQAAPLIRLVKQYNEFQGERVAAAVEKFQGRVSGVEFGREGSPVLYFELPYWSDQREEANSAVARTKISDSENDLLVAELRQSFLTELKADEFSVNRRRVRVWWD
ncbi:MAG: hypothetical protein B0A82_08530 [Alkalinema sp. CACIAM 70d]|nr:MAG: hypothetical protein B0A82_08530 [Alkalinema sp. CACIAM 70d]